MCIICQSVFLDFCLTGRMDRLSLCERESGGGDSKVPVASQNPSSLVLVCCRWFCNNHETVIVDEWWSCSLIHRYVQEGELLAIL